MRAPARLGPRRWYAAMITLVACGAVGEAEATSPGEDVAAGDARLAILVGEAVEGCAWSAPDGEPFLPVLIPLDREALDRPEALAPALACAGERRLEVIPRLMAPALNGSAGETGAEIGRWLTRVEELLRRSSPDIGRVELSPPAGGNGIDPESWAYLIEKISTLVNSYRPGCEVVAGPVAPGAGWFGRVDHVRLAPYIDGLSVDDSLSLRSDLDALEANYPSVPVWVHLGRVAGALGGLERLHEAVSAGARMASVTATAASPAGRAIATFLRELPSRYVPDPDPPAVLLAASGAPGAHWADTLGPERAILLPRPERGETLRFTIQAGPLGRVEAIDLSTGRGLSGQVTALQGEGGSPEVVLRGARGPVLVRYLPAAPGERAGPESIGVVASVDLTAAEIIARLRVTEEAQSRATSHYTAMATLSYNYRAEELDESIDVSSVNRFYWKDGVGEYEEMELYINGARWRGAAPELPFIQAEKVKDVPIEVRMDPSYRYTLEGRGRIDGRPVYVVDFEPAQPGDGLYSGRIWIDAGSFARRRIRLVQHGLRAPITGNEDLIDYGPVRGVEGDHWVPLSGYRQMVFTVLGRSVVVERRVEYTDFSMNGGSFEEIRGIAHESGRRISVDDAEGFSYLERMPGGERIRTSASLRNVAFFGGITIGSPYVSSPVAGLNYFDFDYRGTGTQVDLAWAGPFVQGAWTDPALGETRWELSAEGRLIGVRTKLKRSTDTGHRNAEDLEVLEERGFLTLGHPLGRRSKAEIQVGVLYHEFDPSSATGGRMEIPANLLATTATGRWRYFIAGVGLELWGSTALRSGWEDWGFRREPNPDPNVPRQREGASGTADQDRYSMWGAGLNKSWHPTPLSKLGVGLTWNAGDGLDRFSRFRVGDFSSVRVKGFNGSDLSFDRGATAQLSWLVTIPRWGISLDFNIDGAVIENREDFTDAPSDRSSLHPSYREYLVGGGVNVAFKGPWGSLASVGFGSRLATSLDASRADPSLRLRLVKTFGDWPWSRRARKVSFAGRTPVSDESADDGAPPGNQIEKR